MSAFKEQLTADLQNVWFSELEEFWELVNVRVGNVVKKIKAVIDNDELIRRTVKKVYQETTQNLNKDKKLLMCIESELGVVPSVNSKMIINNQTYTVLDADNQMGLLVIQLERNTQINGGGNGKV